MKLIGIFDGVEVLFDFLPPNTFKAEIPKRLDGIYTVQLQAIDDAGNISGFSDVFVRIDFKQLKFQVLPKSYEFLSNGTDIGYRATPSKYSYRELVLE